MAKKKEQDWGRYFAAELEQEPKSPWEMVGLSLRLVLKTIVFIFAIAIKIIRGLKNMGLRGALRKKPKQENPPIQPFAFNPQHAQMMAQMGQPYPQMPQQPMPQQMMPQQQPMPMQQNVPMQPASSIQRLPSSAPFGDGMQLQMMNEIYGAIGYIRQALVDTQRVIGNINGAINDIYQRLNTIEGVQPVPTTRRKFQKKR